MLIVTAECSVKHEIDKLAYTCFCVNADLCCVGGRLLFNIAGSYTVINNFHSVHIRQERRG